jgi:hypothetical protein
MPASLFERKLNIPPNYSSLYIHHLTFCPSGTPFSSYRDASENDEDQNVFPVMLTKTILTGCGGRAVARHARIRRGL